MTKRGVVVGSAIVVAALALLQVAGGRAEVGWLSGTVPASDRAFLVGAGYVLAWFAAVLVVPITLLSLLLDAAAGRIATWLAERASRSRGSARTVKATIEP